MCAIIELRFLSWGSIRFRSTSVGQVDTPSKLVPVRFGIWIESLGWKSMLRL